MYYIGSRLIRPISRLDPERWIPEEESLSGILYDFTDHTVVTYDKIENKLIWIERDSGTLIQSALVDSPINEVVSMCQFKNLAYLLAYENGGLFVYTGSLQEGRKEGVMHVNKYGVPPYSSAFPQYNPDYCGIFNIGDTIYLLLRVGSSQYIVEFDLLGFFRNAVQVDSITKGLAVAACWHDNVIALVGKDTTGANNNVVWHTRIRSGVLVGDRMDFIYGPLSRGSDIIAGGRYIYSLIANRIFKSEIMMIKVVMEEGWPNTQSIDLGTVASGQVTFRWVQVQNINPTQTYKGLMVYTSDPNLTLSKSGSTNKFDYSDAIMLEGNFAPNATTYFWICLRAPTITDDKASPIQYFDYIYFKAVEVL